MRFQGSKCNLKPIQHKKCNFESQSFSQRAAGAVRKTGEQNWNYAINSWFGLFLEMFQ